MTDGDRRAPSLALPSGMQRGATRPLPRREVGRKGGPQGRFFVEHHMARKAHFKNFRHHPESDLGLLARVRLNFFSTVPLRRCTRVMNDRQKNPQPEEKTPRKNAKYEAQNAKKIPLQLQKQIGRNHSTKQDTV
jgi:hypothetical protein